jgi:F-type H+-transporting ATPase subunit delta
MKINSKQYAVALLESLEENKDNEKEVAKKFAAALISAGQVSRWPEIMEIFEKIWNKKNNIVKADIFSANSLSAETINVLKEMIKEKSSGIEIKIEQKVDKSLLGGVVLHYGDKVLDLSLKNKIEKLKEELNN